MSFAAVLLAPFALLFAHGDKTREWYEVPAADYAENAPKTPHPAPGANWTFSQISESFRIQSQNQVRIEQHMTIRIAPMSRSYPMPPPFMLDLPRPEEAPRLIERKIGHCLPAASIASVRPDGGNRLILFLRDHRMISAVLDRACHARDFYSGFYIQRASDGQLCVNRDTLLSRSGANCKLTRIRQLIDPDE